MTAVPLRQQWMIREGIAPSDLAGKIFTVAAYKGGVGKTLTALELAYLLGAILLDFEWDEGSASIALGYDPAERQRSILIDAIDKERTPKPLWAGEHEQAGKPALIPGHPDFEDRQPSARDMEKLIRAWAADLGEQYGRPIVIDTHPGGSPSTLGAVAAADLNITPTVFKEREMRALEGMFKEIGDFPFLMVPNMTPASPPAKFLTWALRLSETFTVPIADEFIKQYSWLPNRSQQYVVTTVDHAPVKKHAEFVGSFNAIAKEVVVRCLTAQTV